MRWHNAWVNEWPWISTCEKKRSYDSKRSYAALIFLIHIMKMSPLKYKTIVQTENGFCSAFVLCFNGTLAAATNFDTQYNLHVRCSILQRTFCTWETLSLVFRPVSFFKPMLLLLSIMNLAKRFDSESRFARDAFYWVKFSSMFTRSSSSSPTTASSDSNFCWMQKSRSLYFMEELEETILCSSHNEVYIMHSRVCSFDFWLA